MDTDIIGSSASPPNTGFYAGIYNPLGGFVSSGIVNSAQNVMPVTGTLKNFYLEVGIAPTGTSAIYTVYKNGIATSLAITLTSGQTTGNDTSDTVSYSPGDLLQVFASGNVSSNGLVQWTFTSTSAANISMLLSGGGAGLGTALPVYIAPQGFNIDKTSTPGNVEAIMPTAGTIKNAYVQLNSAIASAKNFTFTLYQNGSPTSLAVVINTAVATGNDTNAGHAVTVAAGDRLYWAVTTTAAPASRSAFISVEFDPTTNGESVHMFGGATAQTTTAARYQTLAQGGNNYSTTEPPREMLTQAATWKKLYIYEQGALLAGTYTYQPVINGTPAGPTVTITTVSQTGNDTSNTTTSNAGDNISMIITPAVSPTAEVVEWGIVSYIAPSGGSASITQVAATLTFTGGTQSISTVNNSAISQSAATLTLSGGTQVVQTNAPIAQSAATLTFTGDTQAIATVNDVAISQSGATLTLTGGSQSVQAIQDASVTQVAANLTFTGGTQSVSTVNNSSISQSAATLTLTGGTQSVATVNNVAISQSAATITLTGGTQAITAGSGVVHIKNYVTLIDGTIIPRIQNNSKNLIPLLDGREALKVGKNLYMPL